MTKKLFTSVFLPLSIAFSAFAAHTAHAKLEPLEEGGMEACKTYVELINLKPSDNDSDLLPGIEFDKASCVEEGGEVFAQIDYNQAKSEKSPKDKDSVDHSILKFGLSMHDDWCGDPLKRRDLKNFSIRKVLSNSDGDAIKTAEITEFQCEMGL